MFLHIFSGLAWCLKATFIRCTSALCDLARKRLQLVQQRTLHILSIENLLARQLNLRMNVEQRSSGSMKGARGR